jgi:hypothetical protein
MRGHPAVLAAAAAAIVLLALGLIGFLSSPVGEDGEPILLLPEVRAAIDFERAEARLLGRLAEARREARRALEDRDPLLSRSARLERALRLVFDAREEAARLRPPLAYAERRRRLLEEADRHAEAVRRVAMWLGEPSPERRRLALEGLCALERFPECP